jgi:hypothetical protein
MGELNSNHAQENSMDRYTKFILTVIALSLMWISLNLGAVISNGYAGYSDTKIEIADVTVARSRALPVVVSGQITCID